MKVVRFLRVYRMYQPGETAGFGDAEALDLIKRGIAVDPDAVVVDPEPVTEESVGDPRTAAIEDAILGLDEADYTQSGKPEVDAINRDLPDEIEPVTAVERDAVWAGMQGPAE